MIKFYLTIQNQPLVPYAPMVHRELDRDLLMKLIIGDLREWSMTLLPASANGPCVTLKRVKDND